MPKKEHRVERKQFAVYILNRADYFCTASSFACSHVMVTWWFHSEINISLECIYCCFASHICTVWNFIHSRRTKAWRILLNYCWRTRHEKNESQTRLHWGGGDVNEISPSHKTIAHIRMLTTPLTTRIITAIKLPFILLNPIHKEAAETAQKKATKWNQPQSDDAADSSDKRDHQMWCDEDEAFILIILNLSSSAKSSFRWLPKRKKKNHRIQQWGSRRRKNILWYIVSRRLGKRDYNKSFSHLTITWPSPLPTLLLTHSKI